MPEQSTFAPRSILLPAVLQLDGQAPCFGTITSLSDQGLAFDFQSGQLPQQSVGRTAQLDFDFQDKHHSFKGLIVHVQERRALLSLRDISSNTLAALSSASPDRGVSLAARLSVLQVQQACHARFMDNMKAVVDDFYQHLPERVQARLSQPAGHAELPELTRLQDALNQLRPQLGRQFTQAYPMHPELRAGPLNGPSTRATDPVDMEKVDDWIRRTTIAQHVAESISPLPDEFNSHYNRLLGHDSHKVAHPYQPEAVLDILADLIEPLKPSQNARTL